MMGTRGPIARLVSAAAVLFLTGTAAATQVNLAVSQTQSSAAPAPVSGGTVTWQVVVVNTGNEVVTAMQVTDTVPPQLTAVTTDQAAPFVAPVVTQGATGTLYAWSATGLSLPTGGEYTFTITGTVGVTCGAAWVGATAWIGASGASTSTEMTTTEAGFPLGFGIAASLGFAPGSPVPGTQVTYAITVFNTGTTPLDSLTVVDTIHPMIRGAAEGAPVPGFALALAETSSGTVFTWTGSALALPPGGSVSFTVTGTLGSTCVDVAFSNTAYAKAADACNAAEAFSLPVFVSLPAPALVDKPTTLTSMAGDKWTVLVWQAEANEGTLFVNQYRVWRSEDGGATYSLAGTAYADSGAPYATADTRSFWDRGLTNGKTYLYTVQPMNGCVTAYSDSITVFPMTATALLDSGQAGTVFSQPGDSYVKLRWTANPYPEETKVSIYKIFRATSPGGIFGPILSSPVVNAGSTTDAGLVNMQTYWYMVTPCCPDRRPSFLSAVPYRPARGQGQPLAQMDPSGPRAVRIAWLPAVDGSFTPLSGYAVFRSDDGGANLHKLGEVTAATLFFVDLTVPEYGKRYLYIIRPIDAMGNLGDAYTTTLIDVVLPTNRTYLNRNRMRPARGERLEIIYQITEPGRLRVSVWTQAGELVRKLYDQDQQGSFTVDTPFNSHNYGVPPLVWDGANGSGELVATGIYLIVLEVNKKRDFRTVAVLR